MKTKCLIIDDEKSARETLQLMIENYCPELHITKTVSSVNDAYEVLLNEEIDIIFSDIKMGETTGFDLLPKINPDDYYIIFVTAYNQYAIKAIKSDIRDYILKPINPVELKEAVNRYYKNKIKETNTNTTNTSNTSILLPDKNKLVKINIKDILRVEADNNYCTVFLFDGKKIVASKNLKAMEAQINSTNFIRIHQKHLVNKDAIVSVSKGKNIYIELFNKLELPVSRMKKNDLYDNL